MEYNVTDFLRPSPVGKPLLLLNMALSVGYFVILATVFPAGNPVLFGLLIAGEVFHVWQVLGYVHTVWPRRRPHRFNPDFTPPVAVFITVCGEPADVIDATVAASVSMDYSSHQVYVLNDGFVAKRPNWREAEQVAKRRGAVCITRQVAGGAKAGNINNALRRTDEPFIAVFDADHVPHRDFLKKTIGYMVESNIGFVQSPQYYKNQRSGQVAAGAWDQQALFFGAICRGKDGTDTVFMCGTNMVLRRAALEDAGGMSEHSIAEDFLTSLLVHEKGWQSVYVAEVLAEGLAPEDFLSYYKQQHRWARGSLEVVFHYNPLLRRGLSFAQRIQYLFSASYYLSGAVVFMNAMLPVVFFFTGLVPVRVDTMTLALIFFPYITVVLYTLQLTSNFTYSFRALSFSLGSFPIHLKAISQILTGKKSGFAVTSKKKVSGNYLRLVRTHLVYAALVAGGLGVAVIREGVSAAVITNAAWASIYVALFTPFVSAAVDRGSETVAAGVSRTHAARVGG